MLGFLAKTAPRRLESRFPGRKLQPQILLIILAAMVAAAILVSESGAARLGLLIMVAVGALALVAPRAMTALWLRRAS